MITVTNNSPEQINSAIIRLLNNHNIETFESNNQYSIEQPVFNDLEYQKTVADSETTLNSLEAAVSQDENTANAADTTFNDIKDSGTKATKEWAQSNFVNDSNVYRLIDAAASSYLTPRLGLLTNIKITFQAGITTTLNSNNTKGIIICANDNIGANLWCNITNQTGELVHFVAVCYGYNNDMNFWQAKNSVRNNESFTFTAPNMGEHKVAIIFYSHY